MSRTLEARLKRIEDEVGTTGDATAAYEEMLRAIRTTLQARIANPDTPTAECDDAQAKVAYLNAEQWTRNHGDTRRLDIIDALHEARERGGWFCRVIREHDYDPNWNAVAAELGLSVANAEGDMVRLMTRVIVSPPPRDQPAVTLQ